MELEYRLAFTAVFTAITERDKAAVALEAAVLKDVAGAASFVSGSIVKDQYPTYTEVELAANKAIIKKII